MRSKPLVRHDFQRSIQEALELLENRPTGHEDLGQLPSLALPCLLEQCRRTVERSISQDSNTVRTVHHLACTGGTVISRCIAALPNVRLLSEVEPLSHVNSQTSFTPTDLVRLSRNASRPANEEVTLDVFFSGLATVREESERTGHDLVLRDHSHSAFHHGPYRAERPTLRDLLQKRMSLRSLVTVRHPLDSYLSLQELGWHRHFEPSGLQEYARRYMCFLDRHEGIEIMRYEDFLFKPQDELRRVCRILELAWTQDFPFLFQAINMSGNSGRGGERLSPHPRRNIPDSTQTERNESEAYVELCTRLGYET